MESEPLFVEVVSATKRVWEGDAVSVIARTTEGDVGVLANHSPFLAAIVPCAAEVLTADGTREVVALDEGFISVADNRVSLIGQYASLAREISLDEARRELAVAEKRLNEGNIDPATYQHFNRATAQVRAATRFAELGH